MSKEHLEELLDLAAQAVREAIENGKLRDSGPKYPTFIHPDEPGHNN